jgi:glycosyltransferase involved in cell wall biosynthesis
VPRVSAIIIVLNGETYIDEAIDSVAAQSFGEWELLVVDDGSSDGTAAIVQRYADGDPRIRLLRHADGGNHGMSATRNRGLAEARGEFVAFLDADDIWLPDKLAEQVAILDRCPQAAMVYGRTLIWNAWAPAAESADFEYPLGVPADAQYAPPRLFRQLLDNKVQTPTTCNAMMRRSIVAAVGGFDPAFRDMFEDQIFFAKLLLAYPAFVSGALWAKYRQHPASASALAKDPAEVTRVHLRYLKAVRRHLAGQGKQDSLERLIVERTIAALRLRSLRRRVRRLLGR